MALDEPNSQTIAPTIQEPLRAPFRRVRIPVVLGLLGVVLGLSSLGLAVAREFEPRLLENDFVYDWTAAHAWRDGADPYGETRVLIDRHAGPDTPRITFFRTPQDQGGAHPPSMVLLAAPTTFLPYRAAVVLWKLALGAAVALGVGLVMRGMGSSRGAAAAVGVSSLAIPVVQTNIDHVHPAGFILVLLGATWYFLTRGQDARAGVFLGAAIALRLFPGFMLIPLLRMRRRRAIWTTGATAVAIMVGAELALGIGTTEHFSRDITPANTRYWIGAQTNISLFAIPFRWLQPNLWWERAGDMPEVAWTLALAAVALTVVMAWRTPGRLTDPFWAAAPWMILATPLAWDHSLVMVLPVLLIAAVRFVRARVFPPPWLMLATAALMIGVSDLIDRPFPEPSALVMLFFWGLPTFALLGLTGAEWLTRFDRLPVLAPELRPRGTRS